MKFRGGYRIKFQGKPGGLLEDAPHPKALYLPLQSRQFNFSMPCVEHGQDVVAGEVLAKDPDNYDIPLLAPYGGRVDLEQIPDHICLEDLSLAPDSSDYTYPDASEHIRKKVGPAGLKRYKLLNLGGWEFIEDVYTAQMPDPLSTPQAVIVSTIRLESFLTRGDILLKEYLRQFTRGLEHLQSLLEYQPIYLALPKIRTDFAARIKEQIRGYAWVELIEVPLKYPYDNFQILARHLDLKRDKGPIWGMTVEGVLGIDTALTHSRPCVERVVSISGPGTTQPLHLRLTAGYPLANIIDTYGMENTIVIDGGILTGRRLSDQTKGVPTDCRGINFIPKHQEREFLAFVRPGFDRRSYSGCFLSSLCSLFPEQVTDAVRGELRPCISCGFCEEICPAGILPHRLHKLIYQDDIDGLEKSRIDLCVECGLCSFICPSKIELMQQFKEMKETIAAEKAEAAAVEVHKKESSEELTNQSD